MRHCWQPVCPSDERSDRPKKIKLLCEPYLGNFAVMSGGMPPDERPLRVDLAR